jgi:hypothetical protein
VIVGPLLRGRRVEEGCAEEVERSISFGVDNEAVGVCVCKCVCMCVCVCVCVPMGRVSW